jgi:MOSC domain-containing protein YiiM
MNVDGAYVFSINIAPASQEQSWTKSGNRTGINKVGVEGLVQFANDSVSGDHVVDRENHGGYDQAVYAYALEDAQWWEEKIGKPIAAGQFGENLTTCKLDISNALIGERWRIGDLLLEVSQPRIPCKVFSGFWDRPTIIKEFTEANRPGAYLRIIEEAMIEKGTAIEVIDRPSHGITISDLFAARAGAREKIHEIAKLSELSEKYKAWAQQVSK